MFLNSSDSITQIISNNAFSIFNFPQSQNYPDLPGAILIKPNEKNHISIEEVRQIEELARMKQSQKLIFLIHDADRLTEAATNSFLKLLEEPGNYIHFVFFTHAAQKLLPTVTSRAHNYQLRDFNSLDSAPQLDSKILDLAKEYISATPRQLIDFSQNLAPDREKAILVVSAAIELLHKSYFKTKNPKFLEKLKALEKTYDALMQNGHGRLQLIANML